MSFITRVNQLVGRVTMSCLDKEFALLVSYDNKTAWQMGTISWAGESRVFIQIQYVSRCTKSGEDSSWKGRKWYLSEFMTDDEIIKTCWAAFEAAVKHELLEGFKVDGITLFNPHVDFEELIKISNREVKRKQI